MTKARYLTGAEIAAWLECPNGTVRWYAHRDRWERTEDGRRPVMYLREDVARTALKLAQQRAEAAA